MTGRSEAEAAGITDYESFRKASDQDERDAQMMWAIQDYTNYDTISIIQHMLERYDDPRDYLRQQDYFESYTQQEKAQMLAVNSWPRSLLPLSVMDTTNCYLKYLAVLTGMVLALGIGIGAVTLFLSRFSNNYVFMLLKAFPLLVAMGGFFASWVMDGAFFFRPAWDYAEFYVSKGAEAVCIAVLLIVGAALAGWSCLRQKRLEC